MHALQILVDLGIFFAGLGIFFLSLAAFWWISLYDKKNFPKEKQ